MKKRVLSIFLVIIMIIGLLPAVYAAGSDEVIGNVRVQALSATLLRIEEKGPNGFEDRETYHVVKRDWKGLSMIRNEENGVVSLATDYYTVTVPANASSLKGVCVYGADGELLYTYDSLPASQVALPAPGNTPEIFAVSDSPRVVPAEWGYTEQPESNTENISTNGWDLSNDAPDVYFFMPQGDARTLRADFYKLFGSAQLVELKTLGLWHSRYRDYSADELLALVAKYRKDGFPLDNMVLDTNWRAGGSTGYDINTESFPDMEGFLKELKSLGLNVIFNDHANMQADNALDSAEVAYRNENLKNFLEMGVDSWWYDRNWSASIASPINGISKESFGMYAYSSIQEDYYENEKEGEYPDRNVLLTNVDGVDHGVINRLPDLASHRYSLQWTGDIHNDAVTLSDEIEVMVTQGALFGNPYVASDLGGHLGTPSTESYARWVQYASLSPIMRFHSSSQTRYPWDFAEVEDTTLNYTQLRYRLMPLLYQLAHENYETGLPIARRLDFNYPQYGESQSNSQYLLGNDLLVAPLSTSDTRNVFIPDGTWINAFTGEKITGPCNIEVTCDLTTSPLFVREGAILPLASDDVDCLEPDQWGTLSLDLYPSESAQGSFELYEDDTVTEGYQDGQYRTTAITMDAAENAAVIRIAAAEGKYEGVSERTWKLRIHADDSWGALEGITVNGEPVSPTVLSKANSFALLGEGGAVDGTVYELDVTSSVKDEVEVIAQFADFEETEIEAPVYEGVALDVAEEDVVSYISAPDSVVEIKENAVELTVNGTEYFTFYVKAKEEDAALYLQDGSAPKATVVSMESISGAMNRAVTVKVSGTGKFTASVGIGDVVLEAVTRSSQPIKPSATGFLTIEGGNTSLDLSLRDYLDWFYPSKDIKFTADQMKGGAYLMPMEAEGTFNVSKDSKLAVNWTDGSRTDGNNVTHSTSTVDGTAIISVPADSQTRRLTVYTGIYSTFRAEAYDAAGNKLGTLTYPNTKSLGKLHLIYQSEQPTTVYLKLSRKTSEGNNFGVQCYTLEEVDELQSAALTLQDVPDKLNLSDSKYVDWMHTGYNGALSVNRKKDGTIMQNIGLSGHEVKGLGTDYKTKFSWSDGNNTESVTDTRKFTYSVCATEGTLVVPAGKWTIEIYVAAWKSAPRILIQNAQGNVVAYTGYETSGTASLPKKAVLELEVDRRQTLSVLVTPALRSDGEYGNAGLVAMTVAGEQVPEPAQDIMDYDPENLVSEYTISTVAGWKKFVELVNSKINTEGVTFRLLKDLDFTGVTDVSSASSVSGCDFMGTLDGNNKTISNLTVKNYGLFRWVKGATIKNLNLNKVTVTAPGRYSGLLVSEIASGGSLTVSGLTMTDCTFYGSGNACGMLVGSAQQAALTVTDSRFCGCTVIRETSGTIYNAGLLVGSANTSQDSATHLLKFKNVLIEGCTFKSQGASLINVGIVCGLTEFANYENVIALNNTIDVPKKTNAAFMTGYTEKNGTVTLKNCYIFNSGTWSYRGTDGSWTVTDLYTDQNSNYTATKVTNAYEMAWRINAISDIFAVSNGKIVSDATYPTRKVTFGETVCYTEADGKVADVPAAPSGTRWDFDADAVILKDTAVEAVAIVAGDLNGSGELETADAIILLQYLVGDAVELQSSADLNGDGRISVYDAVVLLQTINQ